MNDLRRIILRKSARGMMALEVALWVLVISSLFYAFNESRKWQSSPELLYESLSRDRDRLIRAEKLR